MQPSLALTSPQSTHQGSGVVRLTVTLTPILITLTLTQQGLWCPHLTLALTLSPLNSAGVAHAHENRHRKSGYLQALATSSSAHNTQHLGQGLGLKLY